MARSTQIKSSLAQLTLAESSFQQEDQKTKAPSSDRQRILHDKPGMFFCPQAIKTIKTTIAEQSWPVDFVDLHCHKMLQYMVL